MTAMTDSSLPRSAVWTLWPAAVALMGAALAAGCTDSGPEKYTVTGAVTYRDQPINAGDIIFEPKEGLKNKQTMGKAEIRDGRYTTEIVGGTHIVNIRDFTGDEEMDPQGAEAGLRPILQGEYRGEVDYPSIDEVNGSGPVEMDIEIPPLKR